MKLVLPFVVIEQIQPVLNKYSHLTQPRQGVPSALALQGRGSNSSFYFGLSPDTRGWIESGNYEIVRKPKDEFTVESISKNASLAEALVELEDWCKLLQQYEDLEKADYSDPNLEGYKEEFAEYFTMADGETGEKPFDLRRQLLLDSYLERVLLRIEQEKEVVHEDQRAELAEVEEAAGSLKRALGKLSQNETIKQLTALRAKMRRFGLGLFRDAVIDFMKDDLKELFKKGIETGQENWGTIKGVIASAAASAGDVPM